MPRVGSRICRIHHYRHRQYHHLSGITDSMSTVATCIVRDESQVHRAYPLPCRKDIIYMLMRNAPTPLGCSCIPRIMLDLSLAYISSPPPPAGVRSNVLVWTRNRCSIDIVGMVSIGSSVSSVILRGKKTPHREKKRKRVIIHDILCLNGYRHIIAVSVTECDFLVYK